MSEAKFTLRGRTKPLETDIELKVCPICHQAKPADHGGMNSTGDINKPTMLWICNQCLLDKVCP